MTCHLATRLLAVLAVLMSLGQLACQPASRGAAGVTRSAPERLASRPSVHPAGRTGCAAPGIDAFWFGANVVDTPDTADQDPANDWARGYGSPAAKARLAQLAGMGIEAVLLPAAVHLDPVTHRVRPGDQLTSAGLAHMRAMIRDAHAQGLGVLLVPHLALDGGAWRGAYRPAKAADRQAFIAAYTAAILPLARLAEAECVAAFSIAVEFKALSHGPDGLALFAPLIAAVRDVYRGTVTYSANWDEADAVPFWPALDVVGINAFFPLGPAGHPEAWPAGAQAVHDGLAALGARVQKPVWFTELGMKSVRDAAVQPWVWPGALPKGTPVDEAAQAAGYDAHFRALRHRSPVSAVFLWAVPADVNDAQHAWRFEPDTGFSWIGKVAEAGVRAFAGAQPRSEPPAPPDASQGDPPRAKPHERRRDARKTN